MKTIFKFLTVFVLGLTLASCSKDGDDNSGYSEDTYEPTTTVTDPIVGEWETTSYEVWGEDVYGKATTQHITVSIGQNDDKYAHYYFYANKTTKIDDSALANYSDDNNLLIMYDTEHNLQATITECNQNTLKLQYPRQYIKESGEYMQFILTFKRV